MAVTKATGECEKLSSTGGGNDETASSEMNATANGSPPSAAAAAASKADFTTGDKPVRETTANGSGPRQRQHQIGKGRGEPESLLYPPSPAPRNMLETSSPSANNISSNAARSASLASSSAAAPGNGAAAACLRSHSVSGISRAKIRTVKLTIVVIVGYILCSAPFICVQLWFAFGEVPEAILSYLTWLFWLLTLNSVVNPWIYMFFNANLVEALWNACCVCGAKGNGDVGIGGGGLRGRNSAQVNTIAANATITTELNTTPERRKIRRGRSQVEGDGVSFDRESRSSYRLRTLERARSGR